MIFILFSLKYLKINIELWKQLIKKKIKIFYNQINMKKLINCYQILFKKKNKMVKYPYPNPNPNINVNKETKRVDQFFMNFQDFY